MSFPSPRLPLTPSLFVKISVEQTANVTVTLTVTIQS
jgi:hypothetical protein